MDIFRLETSIGYDRQIGLSIAEGRALLENYYISFIVLGRLYIMYVTIFNKKLTHGH